MKKWLVPVLIIGVIIFAGYRWAVGFNNTAVKLNENISESWGNVQTAYQRRGDLIGNLVNTVKGAADFEKSTLTAVIYARAKERRLLLTQLILHHNNWLILIKLKAD